MPITYARATSRNSNGESTAQTLSFFVDLFSKAFYLRSKFYHYIAYEGLDHGESVFARRFDDVGGYVLG